MATVAFVGLGVMGFPMAGHLASRGFTTRVWNRNAAKVRAWEAMHASDNATGHTNLTETVRDADVVCTCLGNDQDVRAVVLGPQGLLSAMRSEALLVDHTTTSQALALELQDHARTRQVHFVDAPVSGGQIGAENGQLTIMAGASDTAFALAKPVLESYAKRITWMGAVGNGQLTKMVNQICIAGVLQGLSEGLVFAEAHNLDCEKVLTAIGEGAAQSWQMHNRGQTMVADTFDFGFAIRWMIKDLRYCLEQAKSHNLSLKLTAEVLQHYQHLDAKGGGDLDTSSLIRAVREAATQTPS